MDVTYKIFATIIHNRLQVFADNVVGEYQCGFRKDRSVIDQVFTIKQLQALCNGHNTEMHAIFIDFKCAYDSAKRKKLYQAIKEIQIPNKQIRLMRITLEKSKTKINKARVNNAVSEPFTVGLLSTVLFNIILEKFIRERLK